MNETMVMTNGTNATENEMVRFLELCEELGLTEESVKTLLAWTGTRLQRETCDDGSVWHVVPRWTAQRVPPHFVEEVRERELRRGAKQVRTLLSCVGVRLSETVALQVARRFREPGEFFMPMSVAMMFLKVTGIGFDAERLAEESLRLGE